MGIEDSGILGGLLERFPNKEDLPKALDLYEKLRLERTATVAANSIGSRWFTQMPDGPKQEDRDAYLLAHPGIQKNHLNVRSDEDFLNWLFGYDAYQALEERLKET